MTWAAIAAVVCCSVCAACCFILTMVVIDRDRLSERLSLQEDWIKRDRVDWQERIEKLQADLRGRIGKVRARVRKLEANE